MFKTSNEKNSEGRKNLENFGSNKLQEVERAKLKLNHVSIYANNEIENIAFKMQDNILHSEPKEIMLLLNNEKIIEGYDETLRNLYIGKVFENSRVDLLVYSLDKPSIRCFSGYINFIRNFIDGDWRENCDIKQFTEDMNLVKDFNGISKYVVAHQLDVDTIKNNIRKAEKTILEKSECSTEEKKYLEMIKTNKVLDCK